MVSSWMDWRLAASREENGRQRREREVEQTLEPLIPVPPSFALALCGPDSLPGGQAHWTVGGQWTLHWTLHRSARISARTTPPSLSPTTEALYFATAICAVSLGVGSKLMELVRFLSLTFFFLSCIPYPQVLPAHPEKPGWGGAQGRVLPTPSPFPGFHLGGSVKSHGLVDTGHSLSASLRWRFCNSSAQRPWSLSEGTPSCVVLDSSEAHDENLTEASLVPKIQPSKTACQEDIWI